MAGRVPIARRALFQDRRRSVLATGGVGAALVLILLLDGIVSGAMQQVTWYLRSSPADVIVSQKDVRTMHMSMSALPPETVEMVRNVDGVAWAEGLRYASSTVTSADGRQLSYVFGYEPAGHLGPDTLTRGRVPASGEALVDETAADRLHITIGGRLQVFGEWFTVSGLYSGGTSMINTITFITTDDYARLRGQSVSYVFIGAQPGGSADTLADRLAASLPQATVTTRSRFVSQEAAVVGDMTADLIQIMSLVGFLIALAVIGLTLFTLTLGKLREHAVVKALGSSNGRVGAIVLTQAFWSVALALVVATVVSVGTGALVGRLMPSLLVTIELTSVVRAALGALLVGALGSIIPLRRVLKVDPATAFRRAS